MGSVKITDNDIDLSTDAPTRTMAQGIFVSWTTGVTARIARNSIANSARSAIEVVDNYPGNDGDGFIVVQDNNVVTASEGFARPTPRTPNGITVGYLPRKRAADERKRFTRHAILHNSIVVRGTTSIGINVLTDGALVRNNRVVTEGPMAHAIRVLGSNTYIGRNKIEGGGEIGIRLGSRASANELDGNDFERFKAVVADVMVPEGANDNVVIGTNGSVSDLGAGNRIRGLKRLAD